MPALRCVVRYQTVVLLICTWLPTNKQRSIVQCASSLLLLSAFFVVCCVVSISHGHAHSRHRLLFLLSLSTFIMSWDMASLRLNMYVTQDPSTRIRGDYICAKQCTLACTLLAVMDSDNSTAVRAVPMLSHECNNHLAVFCIYECWLRGHDHELAAYCYCSCCRLSCSTLCVRPRSIG